MALNLVSYDASDNESDEEMEDEPSTSVVIPATKKVVPPVVPSTSVTEDTGDIPKPSEKELKLAELARKEKANLTKTDLLSHIRQKKGKIVIGVPSMNELEEDYEEKKEKKPTFAVQKGQSKLFGSLPPPKNSRHEPPTAVTMSHTAGPVKKSNPLIPQAVARKQVAKKDSDDEDDGGSFFTIEEPALKAAPEPVDLVPVFHQTVPPTYEQTSTAEYAMPTNQQYNLAGIPDEVWMQREAQAQMELDDVALQALQGTSGTKRKLPDDAQVIDIQGERLTYDPNLSSLKAVSEERSHGTEITYNKLQKKKHQITWLAAQAKAREVDLKNQWAANKATKRQTQAKYGF